MSLLASGLIADNCHDPLGRSSLRNSRALSAALVLPAPSAATRSPVGVVGSKPFTAIASRAQSDDPATVPCRNVAAAAAHDARAALEPHSVVGYIECRAHALATGGVGDNKTGHHAELTLLVSRAGNALKPGPFMLRMTGSIVHHFAWYPGRRRCPSRRSFFS